MPTPPYFHPQYDQHPCIAFGIPSLDRLMGSSSLQSNCSECTLHSLERATAGFLLGEPNAPPSGSHGTESTTFCIIGPDGTGKSLLSLHLTSEYARRTRNAPDVKIIYASTDLSFERAFRVCRAFWLDRPFSRYSRLPFEEGWLSSSTPLNNYEQLEKQTATSWLIRCFPTTNNDSSHPTTIASAPIITLPSDSSTNPTPGLPQNETKPTPDEETNTAASTPANLADYLVSDTTTAGISFLDLESTTSGDDWALLHKLLAILKEPAKDTPRHLLVIDAVEGLETLVGETDAFGQTQSRRARIAQIVRAASNKCHIVFVVEEPKDGERLPEVFVADVVVRLRLMRDRDYDRRTVEMEKVRGQRNIRGQHDIHIRQEGSMTGLFPNPDDPEVGSPGDKMAYIQVFPSLHHLTRDVEKRSSKTPPVSRRIAEPRHLAGFGIYQLDSMLWRSRPPHNLDKTLNYDRPTLKRLIKCIATNDCSYVFTDARLKLLRKLLKVEVYNCWPPLLRNGNKREQRALLRSMLQRLSQVDCEAFEELASGFDPMGLPVSSITTLIGNDSTYKSQLARAFLSQCFRTRDVLRVQRDWIHPVINGLDPLRGQGVALLLSTYDTDHDRLIQDLKHHLIEDPRNPEARKKSLALGSQDCPTQLDGLDERVIVRRLIPHHLPSAMLVHIIKQMIALAKRLLNVRLSKDKSLIPEDVNGRIRFVIDDWSTILAMYPEVQRDPLVLPYLTNYLRREGVSTLILATRSGIPQREGPDELEQEIRELRVSADHHLYTWHVSFFGERRVAITLQPSPDPEGGAQVMRELRPGRWSELPKDRLAKNAMAALPREWSDRAKDAQKEVFDQEAVVVDPHFELYRGLQLGEPIQIPLEVQLFAEQDDIPSFQTFLEEVRYLFHHLFMSEDRAPVIQAIYGKAYEKLRELSFLQSELRLKHTLILQVDEFWADTRQENRNMERYLFARTVDLDGTPLKVEDPFGLFQLTDSLRKRWQPLSSAYFKTKELSDLETVGPRQRYQFFDLIGYDIEEAGRRYTVEKVPYMWDFGFLICDFAAWHRVFSVLDDERTWRFVADSSNDHKCVKKQQSVRDVWRRLWKVFPPQYGETYPLGIHEDSADPLAFSKEHLVPYAHWLDSEPPAEEFDDGQSDREKLIVVGEGEVGVEYNWEIRTEGKQRDPVSWREFFGTCVTIAEMTRHEYLAFDVDLMATESLCCLVLEVWFSEVFQAKHIVEMLDGQGQCFAARSVEYQQLLDPKWSPPANREDRHMAGLAELLGPKGAGPVFRRALYRAILLLNEMFGRHDQLPDRDFILDARGAQVSAVSSRHWYSTASVALGNGSNGRGRMALVGLPGHFSVRGDWFLAMAKGSRSTRLGERAMDILCSRRANLTRLQTGLGLPVRDLFGGSESDFESETRAEYWTCLPFVDDDNVEHRISYRDLRKLGACGKTDSRECDYLGRDSNFQWLWRSTIGQYDAHSRIWQRWLVYLLKKWRTWDAPYAHSEMVMNCEMPVEPDAHQKKKPWKDGFTEYDHYLKCDFASCGGRLCHVDEDANYNPRWVDFSTACDGLVESLERASRRMDQPG